MHPIRLHTKSRPAQRTMIYRHRLPVRCTHWINAAALFVLLESGLNIFNAHPRLYWGQQGTDFDPAWFQIGASDTPRGPIGITSLGSHHLNTTGFLGWSRTAWGYADRAWPDWLTIPGYQDLADARHWHFLFAWVLVINGSAYLLWGLATRHLQRDLWPSGQDMRNIGRSIIDHLRLRPDKGGAHRYNVLQRLAYLGVVAAIMLMVATGLALSPGIDAAAPALLDLLGGRQSARSIHFLCAGLLVLFTLVHVIEVMLAGAFNEMRSMITGWFVVPRNTGS